MRLEDDNLMHELVEELDSIMTMAKVMGYRIEIRRFSVVIVNEELSRRIVVEILGEGFQVTTVKRGDSIKDRVGVYCDSMERLKMMLSDLL